MRRICCNAYVTFLASLALMGTAPLCSAQGNTDPGDALFRELFIEQKVDQSRLSAAFELWSKRANEGDAKSQFYLSFLYFGGLGPAEMNIGKALDLVHAAAEQGHAEAQYKLGNAYEFGQGYETDYPKAIGWYERAARQGFWLATERLGSAYANGELGVARDPSKSVYWRSMRRGQN